MNRLWQLMLFGFASLSYFFNAHAAEFSKLPIVYSSGYNLGIAAGIDDILSYLHPFDIKKYQKIHAHLKKSCLLNDAQFYEPKAVTNEELLEVHTKEYLDSLNYSSVISQGVDVGYALACVPNAILDYALLTPMRLAVGGTIEAVLQAMKYGWAINLAGGYHHAKPSAGEGGCFYADVPLAIKRVRKQFPEIKVLIVDLDAHQGNGNATYAKDDKNIFIYDMYNKNEYPVYDRRPEDPLYDGKQALKYVKFNCPLDGGYLGTTAFSKYMNLSIPWFSSWPLLGAIDKPIARRVDDNEYLQLLHNTLPQALDQLIEENNKPGLIIYNAGSDIYEKDDLGILNVTKSGILKRDIFVWKLARKHEIPIVMVPSGGYGPDSAQIVAESMEAIVRMELNR
jgi:histone deacetylase 11